MPISWVAGRAREADESEAAYARKFVINTSR
jgi:hypothetical protein